MSMVADCIPSDADISSPSSSESLRLSSVFGILSKNKYLICLESVTDSPIIRFTIQNLNFLCGWFGIHLLFSGLALFTGCTNNHNSKMAASGVRQRLLVPSLLHFCFRCCSSQIRGNKFLGEHISNSKSNQLKIDENPIE